MKCLALFYCNRIYLKDNMVTLNRAVKDVKSKLEEGKFLLNALNEIESRMKNA